MNWKQILRTSAAMQGIIGIFMIIPTIMALVLGEVEAFKAFAVSLIIIIVYVAIILTLGKSWSSRRFTIRDVYIFVTLTWVIASALGAIPLHLSGATANFSSAYMEVMSGFSTTGLSTIANIEAAPLSIVFWRSLTHWIGGMGIVVLFVALLPLIGVEGAQLYGAETTGPTKSRLTPKIKNTALILWLIYLGITLLEVIALLIGRLPLFDALTISFGTVATGGFSPKNASILAYNSPYVETVVTVFMIMGGINFSLYFALLKKKVALVRHNSELKVYLIIILGASLIAALSLLGQGLYATFSQALRHGAFQVASTITTTGFYSAEYELWPSLAQSMIFILMFVGGCSGSTGGGIKVSRIITMFRLGRQNIRTMLHPKGFFTIQSEKEAISWTAVNAIVGFIAIYIALLLFSTVVVASAGFDLLSSFVAGLTSLGNIGLGMGAFGSNGVGFGALPSYAKWCLSFMMLAGRLELYTVLALFSRTFWKR
ncbi:MAG: TrkH family potassium uptake protein [Sphaerochaetaceae bacterium]